MVNNYNITRAKKLTCNYGYSRSAISSKILLLGSGHLYNKLYRLVAIKACAFRKKGAPCRAVGKPCDTSCTCGAKKPCKNQVNNIISMTLSLYTYIYLGRLCVVECNPAQPQEQSLCDETQQLEVSIYFVWHCGLYSLGICFVTYS